MLRLEAPMMAFGGVAVDENGVITRFPGRSLLTGLLANALGWDQGDAAAHQALQERLRYAVRIDRPGTAFVDFHTVDLGQPHLVHPGWTMRGEPERRAGGNSTGTHIRQRHYRADASLLVALTLVPPDAAPRVHDIAAALDEPARPLFLGRKCCLPSVVLCRGVVEAARLADALAAAEPDGAPAEADACTPYDEPLERGRIVEVADDRDWRNQVHAGTRPMWNGRLRVGDRA